MTEHLSVLLREEAARLPVPAVPAHEILVRGRRVRRRRTQVGAGLAACLVLACVLGLLGLHRSPTSDRRLDGDLRIADADRAMTAYLTRGAYAVGEQLVVGANRFEWHEPIKALHYTAAGVVIQSGENPDRGIGGSRYALVTPTGEWSTIDVALDDQIAGFETGSTHLAWAEPDGAAYELVVHDVVSDEEVARTRVEIGQGYGGWRAPPVAIHGDVVWVHGERGWTQWNWGSDVVEWIPGTESTYEVAGGVYADWRDRERWVIRAVADSSAVRELDLRPGWYGFFSPDGRYVRAFPNEVRGTGPVDFEFFSVATGEAWQLEDVVDSHDRVELGWTPDGHVLRVLDDTLAVCEPDTGACEELATGLGDGTIRLGGEPYSS